MSLYYVFLVLSSIHELQDGAVQLGYLNLAPWSNGSSKEGGCRQQLNEGVD